MQNYCEGALFNFDLTRRPQKRSTNEFRAGFPNKMTTYPVVRAEEHEKEYFEILTEVIKKHVHRMENTKIQSVRKKLL